MKDSNIRSASGKYSVIKGSTSEFVQVEGFNLGTSRTVKVGANTVSSSGNSSSFTFSNDLSKSGYLEVTVNSVPSLNNKNNENAKGSYTETGNNVTDYPNMYNREPDLYSTKNIMLTDDRYIRVFDMKTTGIKNGYYPTMIMDKDDKNNPVFGYIDQKGGSSGTCSIGANSYAGTYYPTNAMPQRAKFNGSSTGTTAALLDKEFLIKASAWDQMGMARDDAGRYYHATLYNRDGCDFNFIYDRYAEVQTPATGLGWGTPVSWSNYTSQSGYNYSYYTGNNAISLETVNYGGLLLGRYQYPKIIAKGNSITDNASVYMAYYDDGLGKLAFRQFQIGTNPSGGVALGSSGTSTTGQTYAQKSNCPENTGNSDTWATGRSDVADASPYFAMGVTSDKHVILVWYDNNASSLVLKHSRSVVPGSAPNGSITWDEASVTFPEYVGTYVSMAIDDNDGIHIAAFDASDSDLVYMYLPTYNGSTMKKVTVDQAGAVGNWTQIKVRDNKPYIAYYNATETGGRESIKLAYAGKAISSESDVEPGIDANGYTTGNWEYMTVPAITPPQGGSTMFQNVCLDFDSAGRPVVGYLGTNIEFGKALDE